MRYSFRKSSATPRLTRSAVFKLIATLDADGVLSALERRLGEQRSSCGWYPTQAHQADRGASSGCRPALAQRLTGRSPGGERNHDQQEAGDASRTIDGVLPPALAG